MMNVHVEILKQKMETFSPELLETFMRIAEKLENQNEPAIPQFQVDELLYRIQFHNDNPNTKLDFYENISDLEKCIA